MMKLICAVLLASLLAGCQSKIRETARNMKYSAYETVGIQKRDLLKKKVDDAKEEQQEAGKSFEDALQKLKSVYGFQGGDLEKQYDSMKDSYDRASKNSDEVKDSIVQMETVASDLFKEWDNEIDEMETASLKAKSRERLGDTKQRFSDLRSNLKKSESRMSPVLKKFHDQVLYLKHNLNAQAITSLKGEALNIQKDIEKLVAEMNQSIAAADKFIQQME